MPHRIVEITNKKGLHARAAAKFVKCAAQYEADIRVERVNNAEQQELLDGGNETVGARSILGLMMLGAGQGTTLRLSGKAECGDVETALDALERLVNAKFDEGE